MAWPVNQPRIVDHHGQGGGQYPGNTDISSMVPRRPGYTRNDNGNIFTS